MVVLPEAIRRALEARQADTTAGSSTGGVPNPTNNGIPPNGIPQPSFSFTTPLTSSSSSSSSSSSTATTTTRSTDTIVEPTPSVTTGKTVIVSGSSVGIGLATAFPTQAPDGEAEGGHSKGLIIVLPVLLVLALSGAGCFWCMILRRRRRRIQNTRRRALSMSRSRAESDTDSATQLKLSFGRMDEEKSVAGSTSTDPFGSSTYVGSSIAGPTAPKNSPGALSPRSTEPGVEIEMAFQKSLAARAERMGLTPRQLLMLITTSLDAADVSDVASVSERSGPAGSAAGHDHPFLRQHQTGRSESEYETVAGFSEGDALSVRSGSTIAEMHQSLLKGLDSRTASRSGH